MTPNNHPPSGGSETEGKMMTNEALPDVMPGHWGTADGQTMATEYSGKDRTDLCMGHLSDFALANAQFMASRTDLDLVAYQQAAKERIRWLSAQLAMANAWPSKRPLGDALDRDHAGVPYHADGRGD